MISSYPQRSAYSADTRPLPHTPPRRPRRHRVRTLLLTMIAVLAVVAIADQVARLISERVGAERFQSTQHLSTRPDVAIHGWPFLTQLARGRFSDVRLHATGLIVQEGNTDLRIQSLEADLQGVVPSWNLASAHADSGTGTVLVTYPELSRALGVDLRYRGAGRVQASTPVTVLGQTLTATASASIKVDGNGNLAFTNVEVDVAGITVPQQVTDFITQRLDNTVSLNHLPSDLKITSVTADQQGVHADLVVHNATLQQPN